MKFTGSRTSLQEEVLQVKKKNTDGNLDLHKEMKSAIDSEYMDKYTSQDFFHLKITLKDNRGHLGGSVS